MDKEIIVRIVLTSLVVFIVDTLAAQFLGEVYDVSYLVKGILVSIWILSFIVTVILSFVLIWA